MKNRIKKLFCIKIGVTLCHKCNWSIRTATLWLIIGKWEQKVSNWDLTIINVFKEILLLEGFTRVFLQTPKLWKVQHNPPDITKICQAGFNSSPSKISRESLLPPPSLIFFPHVCFWQLILGIWGSRICL